MDKTQDKCGEGSEWHIGAASLGVAPLGARPGLGGSVRAPRPPDPPRRPLPCRRLADHRPLRLSYRGGGGAVESWAWLGLRAVRRFRKLPQGLAPASWASLGAPSGQIPRTRPPHAPCAGAARPKRVAGAFSDVKRPDQGPAHHGNAVNVCDYRHVNVPSGVLVM